jgi:hypothetical protein
MATTNNWSKKTQKDMQEARQDVVAGRVREFSNINEFLKGLTKIRNFKSTR